MPGLRLLLELRLWRCPRRAARILPPQTRMARLDEAPADEVAEDRKLDYRAAKGTTR